MIYIAIDAPRTMLFEDYIRLEPDVADRIRLITYPDLFRTGKMERGTWIFTSHDALSPAELDMVRRLQDAAAAAGLRVLNRAGRVLTRTALLHQLSERGWNDFRAHRADAPLAAIRFPVFVRLADEHTGSLTPLLHNFAELRRAMFYLHLRGMRRRELLVIEFCDTRDPDGLYRKYSIFRIGEAYVPRCAHIGGEWMAKQNTRGAQEALFQEERDYVKGDPRLDWVRRIFDVAQIEYGRLDYGVREGRPQAWEINLTPMLVGNPARGSDTPHRQLLRELSKPTLKIVLAGLRAAFLDLDPGPLLGEAIEVQFDEALRRAADRERSALESAARSRAIIDRLAALPGLRQSGKFLRGILNS